MISKKFSLTFEFQVFTKCVDKQLPKAKSYVFKNFCSIWQLNNPTQSWKNCHSSD